MDSDDSRDDSSSGSDSEFNSKGPHSPSSIRSADSHNSKPPSPRGPRSPSPCGPRSPSPEGSESSIHSPKQDTSSPIAERFNDSLKSPSAHSVSSQGDDNTRNSNIDEEERPGSPKSVSSRSSLKSRSSVKSQSSGRQSPASPKGSDDSLRHSLGSSKSPEPRGPVSPPPEDGNFTDSSLSSRGSSRIKNTDRLDDQAEEISDGDMEYDGGKDSDVEQNKSKTNDSSKLNLSHEDLSDVSDLDSLGGHSEDEVVNEVEPEALSPQKPPTDLRQKIDEAKNRKLAEKQNLPEKTSKTEDGEEQLDFEAEDGECIEENVKVKATEDTAVEEEPQEPEVKEEVEEGEVTDDDEVRPEETEPRPVCRFYSRGQCTWGASCRFLHPGVTDKGNYTMFEMIRPMVPGVPGFGLPDYRDERPGFGVTPARGDPPILESAWERGLRTAKEMVRKAMKRKEQDMDFEEKKMNLTLAQDELDKENGYYTRSASPLPVDPVPRHFVNARHPAEFRQPRVTEEYYGRRVLFESEPRTVRIEPEFETPRERVRTYRELPPHRMPDYYNDKYEEPPAAVSTKSRRPKREVILQRVDSSARGDEWADPWMRSKSPGGRGKSTRFPTRRQSYSSASSYSSSSSSRSSSVSSKSSYRGDSHSRSRSPAHRSRRPVPKSPSSRPIHHHRVPGAISGSSHHRNVSPSVIVSEKKAANERALLMNPPAPSPKKAHKDTRPPSPGMMRTSAQNPPAPSNSKNLITDQYGRTRERNKNESERKKLAVAAALAASVKSRARLSRSSSGSDSSGSSSSDSESSYSSSSSSRDGSPTPRRKVSDKMDLAAIALKAKAMDVLKSGADKRPMKLNIKTPLVKKPGLADLSDFRKLDKSDISKKRPASSPPPSDVVNAPKVAATSKSAANNKKATSRREELLKQLKAVEDAIAKKRSKIN